MQVDLTLGPAQVYDRAWVYWSTDESDPLGAMGIATHGAAVAMEPVEVQWDVVEWGYLRRFRATLPAMPEGTLVRYYLAAGKPDGREVRSDGGKVFAYYVTSLALPKWARQAVIYQVMPDRFFPGGGKNWQSPNNPSGFYGGTLVGILEKLDYLSDLGINALWLTPIFPSPSHHGYDATNLFEVEPRLGTKEDLRSLINEAHRAGIRIILDFVPNHWSNLHPLFQQAVAEHGSPYVDWYHFKHWPDDYESFFGVKELPQINLRNPGARKHILDALTYWLEFGVDGYRMDYAIGPSPDFWVEVRRMVARVKPEAWTFGEVVEPSDSQLTYYGELNGCLDFMLLEALRNTFAFGEWSPERFAAFLDRHEAYFPEDFSRPSFLDNHDMNRYLWAAGNDKAALKLAALCQFTLAGPPVIYYGTEVGLSQERDVRQDGHGIPEESRLPMVWGDEQDTELLDFYKALTRLRQGHPVLIYGKRESIWAGPQVVAYRRSTETDSLATLINVSSEAQHLVIGGNWTHIMLATGPGCQLAPKDSQAIIDLPVRCGVILG